MTAISAELANSLLKPRSASVADRGIRITAYATSLLATVALALACQWPGLGTNPLLVSINTADSVLCVGSAFFLYRTSARRPLGVIMAICGPLYSAQFLTTWNTGPWPLIGGACSALFFLLGGLALLKYPRELKTDHWEMPAILGLVVVDPLAQVLVSVFTSRGSNGFASSAWWIGSTPTVANAQTVLHWLNVISAVVEILFIYAAINRIRRAEAMDRYVIIPFAVSTVAVGGISQATAGYEFFPRLSGAFLYEGLVLGLVPFCVVAILFWQDKTHVRVSALLSHEFATKPATLANVQTLLAKALSDPTLSIAYWSDSQSEYIDKEGHTTTDDDSYRLIRKLKSSTGEPLALVSCSPALKRHDGIVTTALNASSVALENARLQANLLIKLEEVEDSRQRIFQAMLSERKRIERDLHDGVQQRILALAMRIGTAQYQNSYEKLLNVDWIRTELLATVDDVRDIARGIHPADLRQSDLKSAIESVAAGLPMSIDVTGDIERLPDPIEATAYFVACEALTNAVKHSGASNARVSLDQTKDTLVLDITDNGRGGAIRIPKGGLNGLTDRVSAVRGQIYVTSEISKGTTIRVEIPCV